jgi:MtN3 and saliva related transmembrane protein
MPDIWIIVGILAGIMSAIQLLPQVLKSFRTKKVDDLSTIMLLVMLTGSGAWLAYGLHLSDWPITLANGLNLSAAVSLLSLKYLQK